jgi:hypothetical protein
MSGKGSAEIKMERQILHIYVQLVVAQAHSGLKYNKNKNINFTIKLT